MPDFLYNVNSIFLKYTLILKNIYPKIIKKRTMKQIFMYKILSYKNTSQLNKPLHGDTAQSIFLYTGLTTRSDQMCVSHIKSIYFFLTSLA